MIPVANPYWIRILSLILLTLVALGILMMQPPVAQSPSFHLFADNRVILGIPNFYNVISNLFFLMAGVFGITRLNSCDIDYRLKWVYSCLFYGVLLTSSGSAYYHYNPGNESLVYDRIPMTIIFMSFLSAAIGEHISAKAGAYFLLPLLCAGIGSVLWWRYTESIGKGDLRLYGFMQFYPMVLVPLIYLLFPRKGGAKNWKLLGGLLLFYLLAKVAERFDKEIFEAIHISGHTIKHILAAGSTFCLVYMPEKRA